MAKTEPAPQPVETTGASPTKHSAALHSTQPLVPYIWRSFPARGGTCYEQGNPSFSGPGPPFSLPPCAWFYPLVHELPQPSALYSHASRDHYVSSSSAQHSFEENRPSPVVEEEEEEEEVPCSLTLAIDEGKKATIYGKAQEIAPWCVWFVLFWQDCRVSYINLLKLLYLVLPASNPIGNAALLNRKR